MGADLSSESPGELVEVAEPRETLPSEKSEGSLSGDEALSHEAEICRALFSTSQEADANAMAESYYCFICMNNERAAKGFTLRCGHIFCRRCLESFLIAKISEADVNISCFHPTSLPTDPDTPSSDNDQSVNRSVMSSSGSAEESSGYDRRTGSEGRVCGADIAEEVIQKILRDPAIFDKYKRFRFMKDYPNARECPKCGLFNIKGSGNNIRLKCEKSRCGFEFCFLHADAHPNETCEQYETRTAIANKASLDLIAETTKRCPGCGVSIRKEGGCNHMKCPHCSQAFCWLCLTKIDDTVFPAHFQWWNATGTCSNLQMDEAVEPSAATRHLASLLMLVQIVVLGPFVLVSTLATVLCCGAFVPLSRFREVKIYCVYIIFR